MIFDNITDTITLQGMKLSQPDDSTKLNKLHCFVRAELSEVFVLKPRTITNDNNNNNNNNKNKKNVVGLRCSQC